MSASILFKKIFTKTNLRKIYSSSIRYKTVVGIDRINKRAFEKILQENINIIYRKARSGSYKFSPYREKLILRGRNKEPRLISIPTIRDKLILKALCVILHQVYKNDVPFLHEIINNISELLNKEIYDGVIRLDVKDFYPSIKHDFLLNQLRKRIRKKEILNLIGCAIAQPTLVKSKGTKNPRNHIGVPQGLSISNILANIYFLPIDKKYSNKDSIQYFRYVDDILVLCKFADTDGIKSEICTDCQKLGLDLHSDDEKNEKSKSCLIDDGFLYLGYVFNKREISVRKKSIEHLRESIIKIFTKYKYSKKPNIKRLKWAIDLRITGCIFKDTKYGWLFFFSQITDFKLLNSLDHFVKKQMKRYGIDLSAITFKKFIRAFHEITKNLSTTNYIPNFDKLSISEKRRILSDIFGFEKEQMKPDEIEYRFSTKIYRSVKELEKDLAKGS